MSGEILHGVGDGGRVRSRRDGERFGDEGGGRAGEPPNFRRGPNPAFDFCRSRPWWMTEWIGIRQVLLHSSI